MEILIKLTDRFLMSDMFNECKKYLLETSGVEDSKKLLLIDTYAQFGQKAKVLYFILFCEFLGRNYGKIC